MAIFHFKKGLRILEYQIHDLHKTGFESCELGMETQNLCWCPIIMSHVANKADFLTATFRILSFRFYT